MNNKPYSIASVILNYNDASTTLSLVRRIVDFAELDYIVVVDNDSSDDSWNRLSLLKNEKVHLLQAGKNGGYGAGNNVGIKYAKEKLNADYVLILNPDVIVEEECIAKLAETLHEKQDVAVVSAKQSNSPDCAWKNCNALQYVLATSLFFEILLKIRCYSPKYFGNENFVEVFAVPGSLLMVDADKMVQFGMYDEDFFLYYEEFVLAQKFANAGLKTILRLDCSYVHNHHVSISKTYKRWSEQHKILLKSAELFLRKYKKVNGIQMAFAKVWFAYTRLEFALYDLYRIMRPKR